MTRTLSSTLILLLDETYVDLITFTWNSFLKCDTHIDFIE